MNKSLSVVFFLLAGWLGLAQLAHAQTLNEALIAAYLNNPTLLAQRAKLRAVDEQVPQALSNWRPTMEIESDAGVSAIYKNATSGDDPDRRQHREPRSLSLSLDQSLYRGGRTLAATSEAENTVKAERARLLDVEQTVLLDVVKAYMDVFRDQAVLELNINNEQVLKRQLEASLDRFEVGETTRTDVHQSEARLARETADRIQAEGDLIVSRASYRNTVGEIPGKLIQPEAPAGLPTSEAEAIGAAATDNPIVTEAEFDEKASLDDVDEVRGELLPSVDLEGSAKRAFNSSGKDSRSDTYTAKVTLSVPLYQSGSVYSRLREARQTAAELRRKFDQARRDATEETIQAWEGLQTARARIESFLSQIKANEIALEGVQREAAVGSRTVLDILDAEQELLDARVDLVRAGRDEMVAIYELKKAMGQLTAGQLQLPVDFYDPEVHYRQVRHKWFGGAVQGGSGKNR